MPIYHNDTTVQNLAENQITKFNNSITKNRNYLADVTKDPDFKKWLCDNKHPLYAKSIWNKASQAVQLIFTEQFVIDTNNRNKQELLQVMGLVIILLLLMIKYQVTLSFFYEEELKIWP